MAFELLLDYDLHLPDDVRVFTFRKEGILLADGKSLVVEARYDDIVLRHYAFRDHWFKVNCTFDLSGRLVETPADDGRRFAFNCDIATPMVQVGSSVFAVDLEVDVLVRSDGRTYEVIDWDDFEFARRRGWMSSREADGARKGLMELTGLLEQGAFVEFLESVYPFDPSSAPPALPMRRVSLDEVPPFGAGASAELVGHNPVARIPI